MRVDLGSGGLAKPGYFNLDVQRVPNVDIIAEARRLPFRDNSVDMFRASHLIEHFSYVEVRGVLREWLRALKPGGQVKITCPDLDWLCRAYVSGERTPEQIIVYLYGAFTLHACQGGHFHDLGTYNEFDSHKAMYTEEVLARIIREAGYVITNRERENQWEILFEARKP